MSLTWCVACRMAGTSSDMHPYVRAGALGFATGLRTMAAPAVLGSGRRGVTVFLVVSALGELIADKLPQAPSRVALPPLTGRAVAGAYTGWRVAQRDASPLIGALFGAGGAVAGAYAGHAMRRFASKRLPLPDAVIALVEDGVAFGAAMSLRRLD